MELSLRKTEYSKMVSELVGELEPVKLIPYATAAVAVIFGRSGGGDELLLLIRRAERAGDPWSGHVALPGGRVEPIDRTFKEAASRETREEVGIDLEREGGRFLGYMGEFQAKTRPIQVVPSVFVLDHTPPLTLSPEVAAFKWVPFEDLVTRGRSAVHPLKSGDATLEFPAYELEDFHVWGVTENILSVLVAGVRRKKGSPAP